MTAGALLALAAAAAAAGCAPYEIEDARRNLLQSWGDDMLLPALADAEQLCTALDQMARDLCDAPSAETIARARQAWIAARAPWKRTEVFAFGPYKEEPLRLGPKIDAWPARPDLVEELLADTTPLTPEIADNLGVFARGFPAIEYLLFQPDVDVVAEYATVPRRCEYLLALTANLALEVGELADAWSPEGGNFLAQLTGAGKTSVEYDTLPDALGEVVNRMGFTAENIAADKLGRPVGVTSGDGSPQPEQAESQFSGRSVQDIRDNLRGIGELFLGGDDGRPLALASYLAGRGHAFERAVTERLDAADRALAAIGDPLVVAIANDRPAVLAAIDEVAALQGLIQTEIIPALSLSVGFNDVDGD